MKKFKVAFIGAGARSVCYAAAYAARDDIEVVALADPSARNRGIMAARAGLSAGLAVHDDWREMLAEHTDLDGAVISTPNHLHADPAVACLERGLPIALEKPLAATREDCQRILDADRAAGGRTLVGFVLRSTPFYLKVHELISAGAIGRVVSIQADELPGWAVTSIMSRGLWRRRQATSGGAMLEKCCHDMDILNWMMGCRPVALHSFGGSLIFRPDAALPEVCDGCGRGDRCPYYKKPALAEGEDRGEEVLLKFARDEARCIYNVDKDLADVQSVAIEYESGAVANFLMNFHCAGPRSNRNFHAVGTEGRVWGNLSEKKVHLHENLSGQTTVFDAAGDGSGHGGGDRVHAMQLHAMMSDPAHRPEQGAAAGYLSAMMCFAADTSRTEGRRVRLAYAEGGGRVDIV